MKKFGLFRRLFSKTPGSPRDGPPAKNEGDNAQNSEQPNSPKQQPQQQPQQQQQQQQQQPDNQKSENQQKEQQKQSSSTKSSSNSSSKQQESSSQSDSKSSGKKGPKFSFPSKTVKPDLPSHPSYTAFTTVDPELWSSRNKEPEEDDGILHIRPVKYSTRKVVDTYKKINPHFVFKPKYTPPQKVLTNPSIPRHNEGNDNENYDLIMHAGDILGSDTAGEQGSLAWRKGSRYVLIDVLGQGTFGHVVKCRDESTNKLVAIKVLKNKPAYFKQGLLEIAILTVMNTNADPTGERRTLRFYDHFLYKNHLCLVNELLGQNLYEVVKQNNYKGLNMSLIRTYTRQILDSLIALDESAIIHCDLKPENVLLQKPHSTEVTLIDFGSACFEKSTMYTYIQSRHYRAPEVILGLRYTCAIDMWSLGCIAAELFLGIPIFPGANEYNQLFKIIDLLGVIPPELIKTGSRSSRFFKPDSRSPNGYVMKSHAEYEAETGIHISNDKKYHVFRNLPELVMKCPMKNPAATDPATSNNPAHQDKEVRRSFLHFLQGCFQMDPTKRWTADQARAHPFINGEVLPENWTPPPAARPTPPNQPPKPKEPSSRSQLDVNAYYSKFCAAMMQHNIIDVASGTVLAELGETLNPPPTDKTIPVPVATRGNRVNSVSVHSGIPMPSVASPGNIMASPPTATSGASSLSPFMIRARGMPVSSGTGFAAATREQSEYVSASANVASAAELHARIMAGSKSHRKRQVPKLAVDTTMQDQPFSMDVDNENSSEDSPSDTSSGLLSPNSPRDKRLPYFHGLERERTEEVASSWSYMPQGPNAGMPRVRPQQPELQEPSGPPSTKFTPLTFGSTSTATSASSVGGSYGDPTTPRHRSKHKHRPKDDTGDSVQKSPLSALTFGSPKNPSLSPLSESLEGMTLNEPSTPTSKSTIEVRVRPKKDSELSTRGGTEDK